MSHKGDVKTWAAREQPLQIIQLHPVLLLRLLTYGFQEILIYRAFDGVEPGPCVGFWFGAVVIFYGSHLIALEVKFFSIYSKDTWHE